MQLGDSSSKSFYKSVTEMYSVAERNKTEKSPPDEGPLISHKGKSFIFTKTSKINKIVTMVKPAPYILDPGA